MNQVLAGVRVLVSLGHPKICILAKLLDKNVNATIGLTFELSENPQFFIVHASQGQTEH
jgi:hypothetical protein